MFPTPQNINILYGILGRIEIRKKIGFVDLYKINRAYNKCIRWFFGKSIVKNAILF